MTVTVIEGTNGINRVIVREDDYDRQIQKLRRYEAQDPNAAKVDDSKMRDILFGTKK